jgi:hypothetical protein
MITVRTIGYHENAPKTNNIGKRKISVVRPPPRTHVTGLRRALRYSLPLTAAGLLSRQWASMGSTVAIP